MPTGVYDRSHLPKRQPPSEETRWKMGAALRGKQLPEEWRRAISRGLSGHKRTDREREIIGARSKGKQYWLGRKHTAESRRKMSEKARKGPASNLWKGGATEKSKLLRESAEYKLWRKAVFERDDYTCQICGQRGGRLNPDHIKRFSDYPELRFDVGNGRTLCEPCHKQTPNYARKGTSHAARLAEFGAITPPAQVSIIDS